ncbi:MAG: insulinase family protein [Treponema sp.]|jgi:Zn-dependent M16 (insulinase) family peptidase|nr:insulinase family protein [Treponema sp.]
MNEHFSLIETKELPEAQGLWFKHKKTGLEVFHILNTDKENLFAFIFTTVPHDSTGVAHILEHSVLCGSAQYPVKDTFAVLGHGSLKTYINAWTFPDKTVYPASSTNSTDYFNLMAVYADAVFHPLLTEWTFMQEGHRVEYTGESHTLSRLGVVFNEMKGEYSSLDSIAADWASRGLLTDTIYAYDSGGNPDHIPDLTWEQLKDFHREQYVPANCKIVLIGNIPSDQQLDFLEKNVLSGLQAGQPRPIITKAPRWKEPRTLVVPCAAGPSAKPTVVLSWLCGDSTDEVETLSLDILVKILLGHDGSPLMRALIESGMGEDIFPASGQNGEMRETSFAVGLRGVSVPADTVQNLILATLQKLVDEKIEPQAIESAFLTLEFEHKEIKRSHGPYSLVQLRNILCGWLYGTKPWETFLFDPHFNAVKARYARDPQYFESLIQQYLLNNPHRLLLSVVPEEGFLEKKEHVWAEKLHTYEQSLTDSERAVIREKAQRLADLQAASDTPEELATIPHLSRHDLKAEIESVPRKLYDAGGVPLLVHNLYTNGITYIDIALPVDLLDPDDYVWLPFFARTLCGLGFSNLDYGQVSALFAQCAADFHVSTVRGSPVPGAAHTVATPSGIFDIIDREWLHLRLKVLDSKVSDALGLVFRALTDRNFSELKRIHDLIIETKNDLDSSVVSWGSFFASVRSSVGFSRTNTIHELWDGLSQVQFIHKLAETDSAVVSSKLKQISTILTTKSGMIASITGSGPTLDTTSALIASTFGQFGPPRPRKQVSFPLSTYRLPAVFSLSSLQIAFSAATAQSSPYGTRESIAESVYSHHLSTGDLWERVRMQGGAYGVNMLNNALNQTLSFSTFRDPSPLRSLQVFCALKPEQLEEEILEKAIIGTFSNETTPRVNPDKGFVDFLRFLSGIDDKHRLNRLIALLDLNVQDITQAARRVHAQNLNNYAVIIAGPALAHESARQLGVPVELLDS